MDITEIKRKRDNLRTTIKENMANLDRKPQLLNKIKQKVILYNELTEQLQKAGCKVYIQMDYLTLEYWEGDNYKKHSSQSVNKSKNQSQKTTVSITPTVHNYIITLAWSETEEEGPSKNAINNIEKYFRSMDMKEVSRDFSDMSDRKEYMIKYEYIGEDSSFKVIKDSAQFMLDELSSSDFDKFNIAIFGKKIK